jgi:hypothetical protein
MNLAAEWAELKLEVVNWKKSQKKISRLMHRVKKWEM